MIGEVVVMEPADYEAWLRGERRGLDGPGGAQGVSQVPLRHLPQRRRAGPRPRAGGPVQPAGPPDDGRTAIADETYLRESIVDPSAKIVAGYENIMPTFKGQITEEETDRVDRLHQVAGARPDAAADRARAGAGVAAGPGRIE